MTDNSCAMCQKLKDDKEGGNLCCCVWCSGLRWVCFECVNKEHRLRRHLYPVEFSICEKCVPEKEINEALIISMVDDFITQYDKVRDA